MLRKRYKKFQMHCQFSAKKMEKSDCVCSTKLVIFEYILKVSAVAFTCFRKKLANIFISNVLFFPSIYIDHGLPDIEIVIYDYLKINCVQFEERFRFLSLSISTLNYWTGLGSVYILYTQLNSTQNSNGLQKLLVE